MKRKGDMMETMTQPKITGYRQLSAREAELMNEIKAAGEYLEALCSDVEIYLRKEHKEKLHEANSDDPTPENEAAAAELKRFTDAMPGRWASIGKTRLQEGLMALVRAVAQPTSF